MNYEMEMHKVADSSGIALIGNDTRMYLPMANKQIELFERGVQYVENGVQFENWALNVTDANNNTAVIVLAGNLTVLDTDETMVVIERFVERHLGIYGGTLKTCKTGFFMGCLTDVKLLQEGFVSILLTKFVRGVGFESLDSIKAFSIHELAKHILTFDANDQRRADFTRLLEQSLPVLGLAENTKTTEIQIDMSAATKPEVNVAAKRTFNPN